MGRFIEFAELLEDKIRKEIGGDFSSGNGIADPLPMFDSSPAGLAWLLGELDRSAPVAVKAKRAYGVVARPPLPRKPHVLNPAQSFAFDVLRTDSPELAAGFTARELKSAFRRSALRHHPDRGGSAESFQRALRAFETLAALVKSV